jgi:formylglycine-generating enzyme required for sulfatase activity
MILDNYKTMRLIKGFILAVSSLFFSAVIHAQNITYPDFYQDGNKVIITYSLDKGADIQVFLSQDGGRTFSGVLKNVSGDVGKGVSPGSGKRIVWDALSEYEKLVGTDFVFKITAGGGVLKFSVNGVSFEMIEVTGGTFIMGATQEQGSDAQDYERPAHTVTLSTYYIGKFEVTQGLWRAVMGSNPSYFGGGDNLPVECVSWNDCQSFIKQLNSLTGKRFSLPTEAQWEYAARGGGKSKQYKYSGSSSIDYVSWYDGNSGSKTHDVGTKSPNELGIFDMSGNVVEWCNDWYGAYSSASQTNPVGPSSGSYRVLRGGSWYGDGARGCRVSTRHNTYPDYNFNFSGLRLALLP